jgi:hypothetical protein
MLQDTYSNILLISILGNIIGYKTDKQYSSNSKITLEIVNEYIYWFIWNGGINKFDISDDIISNNGIYFLAVVKGINHHIKKNNIKSVNDLKLTPDFTLNIINSIILSHNDLLDRENMDVGSKMYFIWNDEDHKINNKIENFPKNTNKNNKYITETSYNIVAIYCLTLGYIFFGEKNRDKIIDFSIGLSKIFFNNIFSHLSGITSALFIAFAIEKIHIHKWVPKLIELLESDKVKKKINLDNARSMEDYISYIRYWKVYLDTRFIEGKPIITRAHSNPIFRTKYYHDNFYDKENDETMGITGYCAIIIAYDTIIDSGDNWEKLIIYSTMHPGHSSATGLLAGAFYSMLYGKGDIPEIMLNNIQDKTNIIKIGKRLDKFIN